jgi:hypothetical protein
MSVWEETGIWIGGLGGHPPVVENLKRQREDEGMRAHSPGSWAINFLAWASAFMFLWPFSLDPEDIRSFRSLRLEEQVAGLLGFHIFWVIRLH